MTMPIQLADLRAPETLFLASGTFVVIAVLALVLAFVIGGLLLTRHFRTRDTDQLKPPTEQK